MKTVYEAANSIEAHMILNLIEQAGFYARVDGDYLQGGVGELQAIGVVRVVVNDQDFEQVRTIISAWEAQQPDTPADTPPRPRSQWHIGSAVAGALIGAAGIAYLQQPAGNHNGIDFNGDGFDEIAASYKNGQLDKIEYRDPDTRRLVKIQWFQQNRLVREHIEYDRDGALGKTE